MPNTAQVISVKQTTSLNSANRFVPVTRVVIMVGEHGPFTKDFPKDGDSPEVINAWKAERVNYVNSIGG